MLLNLRDVFISPGASKQLDYRLDLSSLTYGGIKPFEKPISVFAKAENKAGLVRLELNVSFTYFGSCDRCGVDLQRDFNESFHHILVVSLSGDCDDEYIETPDYEIELDELVTEDILLELPGKLLCKDDCKGLCAKCGKNLNEGDCQCDNNRIDPRLEVLKQLLD